MKIRADWLPGGCRSSDIMSFYDFDQIEQAANDAEQRVVVKPVLHM